MELRQLGGTGIKVSALCLGTMTFGNETDAATAESVIGHFIEAGGNFVDTADFYQQGVAEEITGRAMKQRRHSLVIATKAGLPMGEGPNNRGAGRRHLVRAVEASLRRLGTDFIDLYQVHWPDPSVPIEVTLRALDDLVRAGKVLHVGLSNYAGWELQRGIDACTTNGWAPIVSHQPQYSLLSREIEVDTLPLCATNGIAVLAWSPLGTGVLTGKYGDGRSLPEHSRLAESPMQARRRLTERNFEIAGAVAKVAASVGKTSAQVALNWLLYRPGLTCPILGVRDLDQLKENLGSIGWQLDPSDVAELDKVSRPPLFYPYDLYPMIKAM